MKLFTLFIAAAAVAGCSSIESTQQPTDGAAGLYYFMPRKDFVVTISVKGGKVTKVAMTESAAYPDLATRYVLAYSRNIVGKNTMAIGINDRGLLTSASAETISGVSEVLKNLAAAAGTSHGLGIRATAPAQNCGDGDHVFVYPATDHSYPEQCGMTVTVERKFAFKTNTSPEDGLKVAGVYYRQNEPYLVKASGANADHSALLFSPSASATHLLPTFGTVFGNNHADFTFADGMPSKYGIDTEGELVGLLKLPADVIAAYFAAVGAMFDAFKSNDTKQAEQLNAATALALAQRKYEACLVAIKTNDEPTISKLGC